MQLARSSRRRCRGITLVEVLAGSLLLGGLLTSILIADARLRTRTYAAESRIAASKITDELLWSFWTRKEGFPREESGEVPGQPGWRWRAQRVENEAASELDAEVVDVEVYAVTSQGETAPLRVEVLLPRDEDNETTVGPDVD